MGLSLKNFTSKKALSGMLLGPVGYAAGVAGDAEDKKKAEEQKKKVASGAAKGTQIGEDLYGRTFKQSGEKIQKASDMYENRLDGTGDPITEALKQQKQQSMANVARQNAGRNVAGSVVAAGMEQAGRQKDIDIAASAYQQNAQNLKDYTNLNANIAANQGMLTSTFEGNAIAANPVEPKKGVLGDIFGGIM